MLLHCHPYTHPRIPTRIHPPSTCIAPNHFLQRTDAQHPASTAGHTCTKLLTVPSALAEVRGSSWKNVLLPQLYMAIGAISHLTGDKRYTTNSTGCRCGIATEMSVSALRDARRIPEAMCMYFVYLLFVAPLHRHSRAHICAAL